MVVGAWVAHPRMSHARMRHPMHTHHRIAPISIQYERAPSRACRTAITTPHYHPPPTTYHHQRPPPPCRLVTPPTLSFLQARRLQGEPGPRLPMRSAWPAIAPDPARHALHRDERVLLQRPITKRRHVAEQCVRRRAADALRRAVGRGNFLAHSRMRMVYFFFPPNFVLIRSTLTYYFLACRY